MFMAHVTRHSRRDLSHGLPASLSPQRGARGLLSDALGGNLVTRPSGGTSDQLQCPPEGMAGTMHQLMGLGWLLFTAVDTPQADLLGSCPPISMPLCEPCPLNVAGTPDLLLMLGSGKGGGLGRCERGPYSVDCEFTKGHQLGAWPSGMGVVKSGGRGQSRWPFKRGRGLPAVLGSRQPPLSPAAREEESRHGFYNRQPPRDLAAGPSRPSRQ